MRGRVGRHETCTASEEREARARWARNRKPRLNQPKRIWGEMGRKRKNGISRARAIPGKKVTGRERGKGEGWGGQKAHDRDGGLGDGVAAGRGEQSFVGSEAEVAVLSASRGIHKRVQALLS